MISMLTQWIVSHLTIDFAIQWVGCAFGVAGTRLLAKKSQNARWAWPMYLVSNLCWGIFGYLNGAWGLIAMQVAYMLTSIDGIRTWFSLERKREPVAAPMLELHHVAAVDRAIARLQIDLDRLAAENNYDAELPAGDIRALREVQAMLDAVKVFPAHKQLCAKPTAPALPEMQWLSEECPFG